MAFYRTTEAPKVARIDVRAKPELYNLILADAEAEGISLGEVLTRAYAAAKGVPALGKLEKGKPGPKPEAMPVEKNGSGRRAKQPA